MIQILRFALDVFKLEFLGRQKDSKIMSASTSDVGAGLDVGDIKCDMLEIIDRIFNNVFNLHSSYKCAAYYYIVYFDVTVFLEIYIYFHYLSCF